MKLVEVASTGLAAITASLMLLQSFAFAQTREVPEVQRTLAAALDSRTAFVQPEVSPPGGTHTLHVQRLRLPLRGASNPDKPREIEVLAYNGRLIGPTIRVRRGEVLRIRVRNDVPNNALEPFAKVYKNLPEQAKGIPVPRRATDGQQIDPPHGFYVTNLHTHGLHVSPVDKADNVDVAIEVGEFHLYEYAIPKNHPTGTFWYHPHKHGSVAYQLANGLAGAIIVEGDPIPDFKDLESDPAIAAAKDQVFVLQQLSLRLDSRNVGWVYPDDAYNAEDNKPFDQLDPSDKEVKKIPSQTLYEVTTLNGIVMPTLEMNPGEVQRWRFIHAGREEVETLTWSDATGKAISNDVDSPMHVIAYDGLATGQCEKKALIDLYPGYRCDILLKAPVAPGTYFLSADGAARARPLRKFTRRSEPTKFLAKVVVHGARRDMLLPGPNDLAGCRPFTKSIDPAAVPAAGKRNIEFLLDDANKIYTLNAKSFSEPASELPNPPRLGATEVWTLSVASGDCNNVDQHPFHIHVNPFLILDVKRKDGKPLDPMDEKDRPWRDLVGRWKDTILVDNEHAVEIGMKFSDWAGRSVMHCHILDHEDQGMMKYFTILQANGQALPLPKNKLSRVDEAAPPLDFKDSRGERRDWARHGRRPKVVVFFRGVECEHCTQQLRDLVATVSLDFPKEVTIVAIADRAVNSPVEAEKNLGVKEAVDFHLLEDPEHTAFKSYACYGIVPRHGLFVVDEQGRITHKYIGDAPFAYPSQIIELFRGASR